VKVLNLGDLDSWEPPPPDATKLMKLADLTDRVIERIKRGPTGETLPWPTAHSYLRFPPGLLTIWGGGPGSFKSTILSQVTLGFAEQGARSIVTTLEEPVEEYGLRLAQQATASEFPSAEAVSRFHDATDDLIQVWDVEGHIEAKRIMKMIRYCAIELGAKHFIFDNVTKVLDPSNDAASMQWKFINACHTLARQTKMHIHLVMHSNKTGRGGEVPTMNDIRGSSTSSDLADQICMAWRNRLKEDVNDGSVKISEKERDELLKAPDNLLCVEKAKFGGREGKIGLWRHAPTRLFFHGSGIDPKQTSLLTR